MINYEKYKERIDLILQQEGMIAFNKDTKEIVDCRHLLLDCKNCLFSRHYNALYHCELNRIKWLVSEYKEPEVDWSKVPVDTPVLVSDDGIKWVRRYFAERIKIGAIGVYSDGATSWSVGEYPITWYKYAKLAEVE